MKKTTGLAIATAAAALFLAGCASQSQYGGGQVKNGAPAMHKNANSCKGKAGCKGNGSCKS